jgi:hypothetical protein
MRQRRWQQEEDGGGSDTDDSNNNEDNDRVGVHDDRLYGNNSNPLSSSLCDHISRQDNDNRCLVDEGMLTPRDDERTGVVSSGGGESGYNQSTAIDVDLNTGLHEISNIAENDGDLIVEDCRKRDVDNSHEVNTMVESITGSDTDDSDDEEDTVLEPNSTKSKFIGMFKKDYARHFMVRDT